MSISPYAAWAADHLFDRNTSFRIALFGHLLTPSDWRIRPRRVSEHLLYLVLTNTLVGSCAGRDVRVEGPALLWVDPGVEHEFRNEASARPIRLYHLRFHVTGEHGLGGGWRVLNDIHGLRHWMAELFEEYQRPDQSPLRVRALLAVLLLDVLRRLEPSATRRGLTAQQQRSLRAALHDHDYWLGPRELADAVRLSPDYFRRVFRTTYGVAPQTWIVSQRVTAAISLLLESDDTISEVAERLGYRDVFLFSRQFKQVTGSSPKSYRRAHAASREQV